MISTYGNAHIVSGQSRKIDPYLHLYIGAHAMCIDNSKLKKLKLGNETLCHVISIKIQDNAPLQ